MKKIKIAIPVNQAVEKVKALLISKEFKIFADIDHSENAKDVELDLAASRVLIFGNPLAGTKLMQRDITMSLDLPLRVAFVEIEGENYFIHQEASDYTHLYDVDDHPVLAKIEGLYSNIAMMLAG